MTGKEYRLLSEEEWEYAARATMTTAYFWGEEIGKNNANCDGCGSQWVRQTSPVVQWGTGRRFGVDQRRMQSRYPPGRFLERHSKLPVSGDPMQFDQLKRREFITLHSPCMRSSQRAVRLQKPSYARNPPELFAGNWIFCHALRGS